MSAERHLSVAPWRGFKLQPHDITTDLRRVVTGRGREVRVYDALTAEPLTPVLRQDREMDDAVPRFRPDGGALLVRGGDRVQLWPLPLETRPIEDLVLLARLLSGRQIDPFGNDSEAGAAAVAAAWESLRGKYPASFVCAPKALRTWRDRIVETSEREEQWSAARLHLDQLVNENPNDDALRVRRARARDRAAMEELR